MSSDGNSGKTVIYSIFFMTSISINWMLFLAFLYKIKKLKVD
ncbi:hypothetical protein [uncultured Clostridium sp.]|nr:hypothetical protein [uncultured Clostridium sp.]